MKKKDTERLWSHLFGTEDEAELKDLTDQEFDLIVKFLDQVKTPIDYEINKSGKTIKIWKPSHPDLLLKEYGSLIFLLALMKTRAYRRRKLGTGRTGKKD